MCFDACKSEYDQHNLRDSRGKVCCPYLLSIRCNVCGKCGHTPKYCKKNVPIDTDFIGGFVSSMVNKTVPKKITLKVVNQFSCLTIDDDGEEMAADEIIWGVGLKSLIGKSWADVCNA